MKLIAFVGMPASGKSEAAAIARSLNIPVINMGDVVREETAKRGLPPTDENIGGTGTALRREEGLDAVAKRCVPRIPLNSRVAVVDGIRNIEEVNYFKKTFGDDFKLIAIHTPFELRFERVKRRSRSDDMSSMEELKRRDEREKGWGLYSAIETADVTIENTGTIEKFRKQMEQLLRDL
ncbi:MAG: dephospho-CoA kinase [Candidatus Methanoperedens sp.]|nr:dephospho-CoA kinase [Candidatus Methanoperedens sp.]MCZ7394433.1 dephospho-CoA kinase [Candidatus Methanoperedens sp.]